MANYSIIDGTFQALFQNLLLRLCKLCDNKILPHRTKGGITKIFMAQEEKNCLSLLHCTQMNGII